NQSSRRPYELSQLVGPRGRAGHDMRKSLGIRLGKTEPELRAPPQHVLSRLGPLEAHQIANLRSRQIRSKAGPELVERAGAGHHIDSACAISTDQSIGETCR